MLDLLAHYVLLHAHSSQRRLAKPNLDHVVDRYFVSLDFKRGSRRNRHEGGGVPLAQRNGCQSDAWRWDALCVPTLERAGIKHVHDMSSRVITPVRECLRSPFRAVAGGAVIAWVPGPVRVYSYMYTRCATSVTAVYTRTAAKVLPGSNLHAVVGAMYGS